jgi:hypothetical protein
LLGLDVAAGRFHYSARLISRFTPVCGNQNKMGSSPSGGAYRLISIPQLTSLNFGADHLMAVSPSSLTSGCHRFATGGKYSCGMKVHLAATVLSAFAGIGFQRLQSGYMQTSPPDGQSSGP